MSELNPKMPLPPAPDSAADASRIIPMPAWMHVMELAQEDHERALKREEQTRVCPVCGQIATKPGRGEYLKCNNGHTWW